MTLRASIAMAIALLALVGCDRNEPPAAAASHDETPAPTNRVAIPSSVRSNLGISFVTTERRRVEATVRVPGRFEYLPAARREYRTMLPGRVELLVTQFERVEAGHPLFAIDSGAWREIQQQLARHASSIEMLTAKLESFGPLFAAHDRHEEVLLESIDVWQGRVDQLEAVKNAGGGRVSEFAEARGSLATARADLAVVQERQAELNASRAEAVSELKASRTSMAILLRSAASLIDDSPESLTTMTDTPDGPAPAWTTIDSIVVRATEAGVVEMLGLTNGAWADEKSTVLTVVRPDLLRFHASGWQSDLGVLKDGLPARIVPPATTTSGRAASLQSTMEGALALGLSGDADERTLDLYVTPTSLAAWARPGVAAQLEIVTDVSATAQLAIPLAAVQRDGITPVIFRRAPDDPNAAIRLEADLGRDDGRWVEVRSGLRDGDEIVLDGAFQLMLATSGAMQKGGHFHADGTFHEGED